MKIQLDKSKFCRNNVKYLTHVIFLEGVQHNPDKVHAVKNYQLWTNFNKKLITKFTKVTKPLTTEILQYTNFNKAFILTTDASNYTLDAVLSQEKIPNDRPFFLSLVPYMNQKPNIPLSTKELLGIDRAWKHFVIIYSVGNSKYAFTDHCPLGMVI